MFKTLEIPADERLVKAIRMGAAAIESERNLMAEAYNQGDDLPLLQAEMIELTYAKDRLYRLANTIEAAIP